MVDMMGAGWKVGEIVENVVHMVKAYYENWVLEFHPSSNSNCQVKL